MPQDNWAIFMKTLGSEAAATNPQGAQPVIIFQQPQHCPSKMAAAWNIALIGTHPASAGCGVGGVMVDFASERAGTDDVWVYTTYETRMPFYLKRGFVHCQTKRAPDLYGGDADEFVMFRAAVRDS
ncbi:uncharacterized protein EHS24_003968 [Apiotrichum porosum]|uniref:N-acetyltransferase domain-containing protein n=1 Tax=Apiotrichum porosum TaxID=105984 RepID=A0A427XE67_9TREE|nr:uncharacterized protein EHS24_003968 [Apiotrichum porosum]RSH77027.1 hypothetical protein EHS24_003968 [Apiotrichum porosum]